MRYLALTLLAAAVTLAAVAPAEDYFPEPDSAGGWRTLKDAPAIRKTAGMDLKKLDQAFEYASRSSQHGGQHGGQTHGRSLPRHVALLAARRHNPAPNV